MHLITLLVMLLSPPTAEFPPQAEPVQAHYKMACEYVECGDATAPMVVFTDTGRALGYYYFGTDTVFVSEECLSRIADATKCSAVVIHEMVHYILDKTIGLRDNCESETRAWDVYNAYVIDQGRLDLVREDWVRSYPQCAKSQNDSDS